MTFARNLRIVPRFTKLDSNTADPWLLRTFSSKSNRVEYILYVCMYGHTLSKSTDQPGKVANGAHGHFDQFCVFSSRLF